MRRRYWWVGDFDPDDEEGRERVDDDDEPDTGDVWWPDPHGTFDEGPY